METPKPLKEEPKPPEEEPIPPEEDQADDDTIERELEQEEES